MSKFGKKFSCWKCSTKFYDLNKPNVKCPKCGTDPEDDPNKGMIVAAPPVAEDFGDDVEEEVPEEVVDEEEADDDAPEDEGPAEPDDY